MRRAGVLERRARLAWGGEGWLCELCVSLVPLEGPVPTPSGLEVPKSRCWHCPGTRCHGQGAGMDRAGARLDLSVQAGWGGMEGLQQRTPVPIHIPFPVPSPVPILSLLSLPRATCLPAVPYMSPPCSLIVLPVVRGSTDLNKGV